jgi:hypothetical protein
MLLTAVTRTLQLAVALAALDVVAGAFLGIDLSSVVVPVMRALWAVLVTQGTVFLAWNAVSGAAAVRGDAVERRYQEDTAQLERHMRAERVHPAYVAMRRAAMAGTYSVNGVRQESAHLSGPGSLSSAGGRTLPAGLAAPGRISKSGCDWCGVPLDVAWCVTWTPYLCPPCREQEILSWTHEQV